MIITIALTGGIAAGKSVVLEEASWHPGVKTIQADQLAWESYRPGTPEYRKVVELFGEDILDEKMEINRAKLAKRIFGNPLMKEKLEQIVHPFVQQRIEEIITKSRSNNIDLLIFEIPLLFQSPEVNLNLFDEVILVSADVETRIHRLVERDGLGREEAQKRLRAQELPDDARERSDYIIHAEGSIEETKKQARKMIEKYVT